MPSDLFERDFDAESLDEYRQILGGGNVLTLPLVNGNTPDDVTHPGAARDLQYAQLGAFIAAHCHILLALWDGNEDGAVRRNGRDHPLSPGRLHARVSPTANRVRGWTIPTTKAISSITSCVRETVRTARRSRRCAPARRGGCRATKKCPRTVEMPDALRGRAAADDRVQRGREAPSRAIESAPNALLARDIDHRLDRAIAPLRRC